MTPTAPSSVPGQSHPPGSRRPTFAIACWLLALIAFGQLISVGTALTVRMNQPPAAAAKTPVPRVSTTPQPPVQPRSLAEILASVGTTPAPPENQSPAYGVAAPLRVPAQLPAPAPATSHQPPAASQTRFPTIADPVVERLVQESRALQMDCDMMRAMLKLDEAGRIDPTEPAVIYQKALLFEEMGLLTKAADHYQQVQQMGLKAGVYFKLAANKLTKGMDVAHAQRPVVSIGPMSTRKGTGPAGTRKANVSITILARPDTPVNPADVHVQVHFYDKLNGGEIKKASPIAQIKTSWGDGQTDWKDLGNEETLHVSYTIPEADLADEHLLGRREFYGYVVELLYKGEVIDQQARPRRLHSIHGSTMAPTHTPDDLMPWLPGDPGSLLPSKDGYGDNPARPPLPTR